MTLLPDDRRRLFTREEVLRMVETGVLTKDEHVELIDGELIVMPPQGPAHASLAVDIHDALAAAYGKRAHIRGHSTMDAGLKSLPEPDVVVVRGAARDYRERLPTGADVLLLVELSVTTQAHDRAKAKLYARAGVVEYWHVDVPGRRVDVYSLPLDGLYTALRTLGDDGSLPVPGTQTTLSVRQLVD